MRTAVTFFVFIFSGLLFAQDSTTCVVYQFYETDSATRIIVNNLTLNSRNKVIYEKRRDIAGQNFSLEFWQETRNVYSDTVITEVYTNFSGSKSKYVYEYDQLGRRYRESIFDWRMEQSQDFQHHSGPGSDNLKGKWEQVSLATITYDQNGNKIQWDATRLHNTQETTIRWEYDEQNRVTSEKTFSRNGRKIHQKDYQYFEWGYRYWIINYDAEGNPRHELEGGQGYQPMIIHVVLLDSLGRIVKDATSDEKSTPRGTIKYSYDLRGRIVRQVNELPGDEPVVVQVYKYSK